MTVFAELDPPYSAIVVDPPWDYGADGKRWAGGSVRQSGAVMNRRPFAYSTMSLDEIRSLPVGDLAAPDCWLFLWTTNRFLFDSPSVLAAWGFTYRQTLIWRKTGQPSPFGGSLAPNGAEFLVVAARGRPPVRSRLASSVISAPRASVHSAKPDAVYDAIEEAVNGPFVDIFCRAPRLGWDSWGHGYEIGATA